MIPLSTPPARATLFATLLLGGGTLVAAYLGQLSHFGMLGNSEYVQSISQTCAILPTEPTGTVREGIACQAWFALLPPGLTTSLSAAPQGSGGEQKHFSSEFPKLVQTRCLREDARTPEDIDGLCKLTMQLTPPIISESLRRTLPFLWYIGFSILALGGWLFSVQIRDRGLPGIRITWLIGLFVCATWVLFTTLSRAPLLTSPLPNNQMPEMTRQLYPNLSQELFDAMTENQTKLQASGCLRSAGMTGAGIEIFTLRDHCIQVSFFQRVVPPLGIAALVLFNLLVLGSLLLRLGSLKLEPSLTNLSLSLATGTGGLIALLWTLGILGAVTPLTGWVTLLVIPAIAWREVLTWWRWARDTRLTLPSAWGGWNLVLGWLLLSLLALNMLSVIRPFPIGWDDLGSYINRPKQFVDYASFLPTMATFQWEYITSLGFWLFGTGSITGAIVAMTMNWAGGFLALAAVGATTQFTLRRHGLLAAVLYYTLPMVGHFSFADMKIDNPHFGVMATSVLCLLLASEGQKTDARWSQRLFVLAGLLCGLSIGMKLTGAMVLLSGLIFLGYRHWGWWGFISGSFVALAVYASMALAPSVFLSRLLAADVSLSIGTALVVCGALALASGIIGHLLHARQTRVGVQHMGLFLAGVAVAVLPWLAHNNIWNGNTWPKLALNAHNTLAASISLTPQGIAEQEAMGFTVRSLPADLAVDLDDPTCRSTARAEELDRYWGSDSGPWHYLSLPWRTVMNTNINGYYVTTSAFLLLLPLLLAFATFWKPEQRSLRLLMLLTTSMVVQWTIVGNGVPWYGLVMFLGLCVGGAALVTLAPDRPIRLTSAILVGICLCTNLGLRLQQFTTQSNYFDYAMGKASVRQIHASTVANYLPISADVSQRAEQFPDRPFTYRMGTFIPYFIDRSVERFPVADNQLDTFNCLFQEGDAALTVRRLKALGFNAMIFDTNTASIERVYGTLHKKVDRFATFANTKDVGITPILIDTDAGLAYFHLN
jgi:hypothetical protein